MGRRLTGWLVLRALGDDRYYELGVHYLVEDPGEVALDFRLQLDNPNPTGDRYRLYRVEGDPVDVHDE